MFVVIYIYIYIYILYSCLDCRAFLIINDMKPNSIFSVMLKDVFQDCRNGLQRIDRNDSGLLNFWRFQVIYKVKKIAIRNFLFVDNCDLNVCTEQKIHQKKNTTSYRTVETSISPSTPKKTEVMCQSALGRLYQRPHITVKASKLQVVNYFN